MRLVPKMRVLLVVTSLTLLLAAPAVVHAGFPSAPESLPQESIPEESLPQESLPQESLPQESQPEETIEMTPPGTTTGPGPSDEGGPPPPDGGSFGSASPGDTVATGGVDGVAEAFDPVETAILMPVAADDVVILEESVFDPPPPDGWVFLGQQVTIEAPDSTAENPYVIVFLIDTSVLGGQTSETLTIMRNGVAVAACEVDDGTADPDPCVANRETLIDGDARITVLSSHASIWTFAAAAPGASLVDSAISALSDSGLLAAVAVLAGATALAFVAYANVLTNRRRGSR